MKAGFSLHYRIVELEQDKRMLMTVNSKLFTAREEILFGTTKTGTTVRYIANFNFPSPLAAANRIYPAAMDSWPRPTASIPRPWTRSGKAPWKACRRPWRDKVGKSTMEGLQAALEDNFEPPEASRGLALADRLVLPGIWRFTRLGYRSSRKRWKPVSAYLEGRHALVTGATSGVGLAAAKELASGSGERAGQPRCHRHAGGPQ
jgi:hypothetical protein